MGRNKSKNLSIKCSQKLLGHAKHSATDVLKNSSRRFIQKTAEAIGDLIENKIADEITNSSEKPLENKLETNEGILSEKYISPELGEKVMIKKIINLLHYTTNQPSKFRTRNWVQINDKSKGRYDNNNVRFKASIIRSNLCDYSDSYILFKETITVPNTWAAGTAVNNKNKKYLAQLKNCASFTDCITEINNTQMDDAQKIDVIIPIYNLVEYGVLIRKHQEVYGNIIEMSQL